MIQQPMQYSFKVSQLASEICIDQPTQQITTDPWAGMRIYVAFLDGDISVPLE